MSKDVAVTELLWMDVDAVHLVGRPASKHSPLLAKSEGTANTLTAAYAKWKAQQAAGTAPLEGTEARAMKKSGRKMTKLMKQGVAPTLAVVAGHRRYREVGGALPFAQWAERIARG